MASKIYQLNSVSFKENIVPPEDIVFGLERGEIGFINAAPDSGKSYLCLSLAYEIATNYPIIGLAPNVKDIAEPTRRTVLYWSAEDSIKTVLSRVRNHFEDFSDLCKSILERNISCLEHPEIACRSNARSEKLNDIEKNIIELITIAKDYDCLIIDTLREAIGDADEVEDDIQVKNTLQRIAKEANVAIIVTHHLTKAAVKNEEVITAVSGSGFSRTLANARWGLTLVSKKQKNGVLNRYMTHVKANNVDTKYRISELPYYFNESSLVFSEHGELHYLSSERKEVVFEPINEVEIELQPDSAGISETEASVAAKYEKFLQSQNKQ